MNDTSIPTDILGDKNLQYVLEPCELPLSIDKNKLIGYVSNYMEPRHEFYKETNRAMYIEDAFSEWWTVKASGGIQVGNGNGSTDVITQNNEGIDAMRAIMNMKNGISNEKSLIQNFKTAGYNLDLLFKNNDDEVAIKMFMDMLYKKLINVSMKHNLTELYILSYISVSNSVYVCCFKYNINLIGTVISSGFSTQGQSISTNHFIDKKFGNVRLSKAKKRIELRLSKSCITDNPFAIKIY